MEALKQFEERAQAAEQQIKVLTDKLVALEQKNTPVASVIQPRPVGKIPIGHTAFSWNLGAQAASPATAGSASSSSTSSQPQLTSVIIRHGAEQSALTKVTAALLSSAAPKLFKAQEKKGLTTEEATLVPLGTVLYGAETIARFLARYFPQANLFGGDNTFTQTEVDQWIFLSGKNIDLAELNAHLTFRTFLVEYGITLADIAVFGALKQQKVAIDEQKFPHAARWFNFLASLPAFQAGEKAAAAASKRGSQAAAVEGKQAKMGAKGVFLELKGAQEGKVCTRFPPEPSGYLHIGHAKAALLNNHYARHYKGKLIVRFDDTNPTKEKDEFEQSILEDLKKMQIVPDQITHTSDYFEQILEFGEKLLRRGLGYIDTTDKLQIREERDKGIESKCRNNTLEENLRLWEEMKKGSDLGKTCVMRGKIDMKALNKVLRDPAFFRCVDTPHHRTGTKYRVYPLYDFACPIVDSLEGISHALRSNEYHDRNALYDWFFTTAFPEIQKVVIEDFSRLNFKYVLLSKRKLQHFVDKGLVSGWDHPSFPTIQGVWRRGLTYEALRDFVLSQGGSKATNLMEMEKLWAVNKSLIDPEIPRHTAIASNKVKLVLADDVKLYSKKAPRHKKNPALGEKDVYYSNVVYLEPADAAAIKVNEEVTLMDWGNAIITEKVLGEDGSVKELKGKLHLAGDFKTTEKKLTWLAEGAPLVPVKLEEYHYLIKKEKLEEGDNLDDFINSPLVTVTEAIGDPNLASLPVGTKLQLERRGYYVVDKAASSPEGLVLINTPDGKKTNVYKLGE